MNLIRNIFKSIAILFGIAVLVIFCGFAIMMFANVEIFGYRWFNTELTFDAENEQAASCKSMYIETNGVAVEVRNSADVANVEITLRGRAQGVLKSAIDGSVENAAELKAKESPVTFTEQIVDGVYQIKTQELEGLNFVKDCKLTIWLPKSMNLLNLDVKTGNDKFSLGEKNITLLNFSFESTSQLKEYTFTDNLTVGENFKLKTKSGRVNINSGLYGNVQIESDYGTFLFNEIVGDIINGDTAFSIKGLNPQVELVAKQNETTGIAGDVAIECTNGGLIKINGIVTGSVTVVKSPIADMYFKTVNGEFTVTDGFKNLKIDELKGEASINKGDGTLTIGKCESPKITVTGSKNAVNIDEIHYMADISNDYGDVNVKFVENAGTRKISTKNGNIKVRGVFTTTKLISEKGNIDAEIIALFGGGNEIITAGNVNVKIADNYSYNLTIKSKTNNIDVGLGGVADFNSWDEVDGVTEVDGYKVVTKPVSGGSTEHSLLLQTEGGSIKAEILVEDAE